MGDRLTFSSVVWREDELFVAWCPELDIASQGKTFEDALENLQEAVELYLEDEDATIPKEKFALILTTLSVEVHAETASSLR